MKNPLLATAFPFYLALDKQLEIVEVGKSLGLVCPDVVIGCVLEDLFEIIRPRSEVTFTSLG